MHRLSQSRDLSFAKIFVSITVNLENLVAFIFGGLGNKNFLADSHTADRCVNRNALFWAAIIFGEFLFHQIAKLEPAPNFPGIQY